MEPVAVPTDRVLRLFVYDKGRYLLRPRTLNSYRWACVLRARKAGTPLPPNAESPSAAYLGEIREQLDIRRLKSHGVSDAAPATISDGVLAATVMGGITGNPAFIDIVDDGLTRAACLCCYYTRQRRRAVEVEQQICRLLEYFDQAGYEKSKSFYRQLGAYCRDLVPTEVVLVGRHARAARAARLCPCAAFTRWVSGHPGICMIHAVHTPSPVHTGGVLERNGISLWLCSTPKARQSLRRLSRAAKKSGLTLRTVLATDGSYRFFCLRFKVRYYVLEFYGEGEPATAWKVMRNTKIWT